MTKPSFVGFSAMKAGSFSSRTTRAQYLSFTGKTKDRCFSLLFRWWLKLKRLHYLNQNLMKAWSPCPNSIFLMGFSKTYSCPHLPLPLFHWYISWEFVVNSNFWLASLEFFFFFFWQIVFDKIIVRSEIDYSGFPETSLVNIFVAIDCIWSFWLFPHQSNVETLWFLRCRML